MANRQSDFGVALGKFEKDIRSDLAPKLKYNYTMTVNYGSGLSGKGLNSGNSDPFEIEFALKQFTRPNINVVYDDVNFYNFMAKVATRVDFGVVTVTLYDDRPNLSHDLFSKYMEYISPITNANPASGFSFDAYGLDFGSSSSSTINVLDDADKNGPIRSISVYHFHKTVFDPSWQTIYHFINYRQLLW